MHTITITCFLTEKPEHHNLATLDLIYKLYALFIYRLWQPLSSS